LFISTGIPIAENRQNLISTSKLRQSVEGTENKGTAYRYCARLTNRQRTYRGRYTVDRCVADRECQNMNTQHNPYNTLYRNNIAVALRSDCALTHLLLQASKSCDCIVCAKMRWKLRSLVIRYITLVLQCIYDVPCILYGRKDISASIILNKHQDDVADGLPPWI
jgi:hypothetical protein